MSAAEKEPREPRLTWPLEPRPEVMRPFDPPDDPYGKGHRGVDLGARTGQPVLAAGEGVVVYAGRLAGRGVVSIDHGYIRTTYEPVKPSVHRGDQVSQGQRIGVLASGHEGCRASACLHWGARKPGKPPEYVNPLTLIADGAVRLKPWEEG